MGSIHNQFIFDAISVNCVELGQGRFGARSIRACLDNPNTTSLQKEQVGAAILENCLALVANPNGSILITWLIDSSTLPNRMSHLAKQFCPHLAKLILNKVSSSAILKLGNVF
jgi:protein JSN1